MARILQAETLLKLVAGLFLGLLVYQGKCLCERVDSLERNQVRIMVKLGVEPIARGEHHDFGGSWGSTAAAAENHGNQKDVRVP